MSKISMSLLRGSGSGGSDISLEGSLIITKGTSEDYLITDFNSFSEYVVRGSAGFDVQRSGDTITVTIPAEYLNNQATFFVSRDGNEKAFTVAMDDQSLVTPRITSPVNGSIDQSTNLTIIGSAYTTIPSGLGTLEEAQWQIATDNGFAGIIKDETISGASSRQFTVTGLPIGTQLFVRVRYKSSEVSLGWSEWSGTTSFTTSSEVINTPRIGLDQPPFDVNETPTFTAGTFTTVPANSDSHLSSSWRVVKVDLGDTETVVYSVNRSMENKQSLTLPKGILETSSEYYAQVRFEGSRIGESAWSDPLIFSTATTFVPDEIGTPWEGGFYAGRIMVNDKPHAIVMASKVEGGWFRNLQWKTSNTFTPNTDSTNDSYANMQGVLAAGISLHPASNACYTYRGGGYSDWLLGAKDVVEIMYRNFKPSAHNNNTSSGDNPNAIPPTGNYTSGNPAQTLLTLFRDGAAEAFTSVESEGWMMYTSTQGPREGDVWRQNSRIGSQFSNFNKTYYLHNSVRPVRIIPID